MTYYISLEDFTIAGLSEFLSVLPELDPAEQSKRSSLLWDGLCDLEARRGLATFSGTYRWFYFRPRSYSFDSSFVRTLNETCWVPSSDGGLKRPGDVVFDDIDPPWRRSPGLLSLIRFKPPVLAVLAREAGIDIAVIDLLRKLGVTSEQDLKSRLKLEPIAGVDEDEVSTEHRTAGSDLIDRNGLVPTLESSAPAEPVAIDRSLEGSGASVQGRTKAEALAEFPADLPDLPASERSPQSAARSFVSYLAVSPENEKDAEGLGNDERIALETAAIELILKQEPSLQRTPLNNPGFDLVELTATGKQTRWVEVKAMKHSLKQHAVGLSKAQFATATVRRDAYWLYIVEQAGTEAEARIIRIQDPAGKAQTFMFDHGWLSVADSA